MRQVWDKSETNGGWIAIQTEHGSNILRDFMQFYPRKDGKQVAGRAGGGMKKSRSLTDLERD